MGHHESALHIITDMKNDDIKIDEFSTASFLSASADLGTIMTGKQLHCHSVKSGERSHPRTNEIYEQIESFEAEFKKHGYLFQGIGHSYYHSEKLAVVFGLLNTPSKATIYVIKNSSICRDCHNFMTFVTQLIDREIIVREVTVCIPLERESVHVEANDFEMINST
ncbi:pentatricopeptide repeat-containing protein At5g52850, chloroplastic-like [Gossypium hirsutum]|uniref:Pentatricopeptide repeat-containing protein At5g52850, chloroplastic-like n=1 Tax=Gossypium hirsutum TaxID=3635 RepID=A0ABM3BAA9_GOSHI|nr:pentatricopeptide repeat-containing protein At5g52850, chloroplastic-like [Gossypium hirsutum]